MAQWDINLAFSNYKRQIDNFNRTDDEDDILIKILASSASNPTITHTNTNDECKQCYFSLLAHNSFSHNVAVGFLLLFYFIFIHFVQIISNLFIFVGLKLPVSLLIFELLLFCRFHTWRVSRRDEIQMLVIVDGARKEKSIHFEQSRGRREKKIVVHMTRYGENGIE